MHRRDAVMLALFAGGTVLLGLGSGLSTIQAAQQYGQLQQPSWAPPGWLFGPVWTVLYALVGVAGFFLWRSGPRSAAMAAWGVQLVLNLAWTPLFFGLGWRGVALVNIVALLAAIAVTLALAWRRARLAAYLLLPYIAWVAFATALNAAVWALNR